MSDLLLDVMNVVALNGYVQNIAKIRETCKEASQLEILNERVQSEYDEWHSRHYAAYVIQYWWYHLPIRCTRCKSKKHVIKTNPRQTMCDDCDLYVYERYEARYRPSD